MKDILEETLAREEKIFEKLYNDLSPKVYSLARFKGLSKEDSQDVVQDTFSAVFAGYHSFENKSSVKTYVISIAQNKIADFYRRKYKKNETALDENIESESGDGNIVETADVKKQVAKLTDEQQMLIHLIFTQGLNFNEAAAVMGIPPGTVKSRMFKIRSILKHGLGEDYR